MTYELGFIPVAEKEWNKLPSTVKILFKKQLEKRLQQPKVVKDKLRGELKDCYKIKLRQQGYRLVYQVVDHKLLIVVIAVGKRSKNVVYSTAKSRMH